jgi:predicted ester cyclase
MTHARGWMGVGLFSVVVACGGPAPNAPAAGGGEGGGTTTGGKTAGASGASPSLSTLRAMEEAFAAGDAKSFGALMTDDVTVNIAGKSDVRGRPAAEEGFTYLTKTFGKVKYKVRRVFTKGDVAIVEWSLSGTHEGPLGGVAPTHSKVGWNGAEVDHFTPEGKIRERHVYFDQGTALGQVGKPLSPEGSRPIPDGGGALQHIASSGGEDETTNPALLEKINKAWETHDETKWATFLADDVEWDDFAMAKPAKGKDGVRAYFRIFSTAFPQVTSSTINGWGIGSFVIEEGSFTGVHKGPYMNIPPTSRLAVVYELNIVELAGGKIKRGWTYSNELDLRDQLGVKPGEAKPAPGGKKK